MTVKLFENNSLLKECTATVTACTEKEGRYLVELDQTVFFPEGGGQPCDLGTLGQAKVLDVQEKDGTVFHTVDFGHPECGKLRSGRFQLGECKNDLSATRDGAK